MKRSWRSRVRKESFRFGGGEEVSEDEEPLGSVLDGCGSSKFVVSSFGISSPLETSLFAGGVDFLGGNRGMGLYSSFEARTRGLLVTF